MTDSAPIPTANMDDIVALCRRRGFIWQSSEIYGGINGFWDYGPLGTELKRNLKNAWWNDLVACPPDGPDGHPVSMVGVDCTIIMHPKVWEASGHVAGFNDPMMEDKGNGRFRADHLVGVYLTTDRGDEKRSAAAMRIAVQNGEDALPIATVVASSEGEAIDAIRSHPKILAPYRLRVKRASVGDEEELSTTTYFFLEDKTGQEYLGVLCHVPTHTLKVLPEKIPSPITGKPGTLTEPRQFNLMFETYVGAIRDEDAKAYLRPETAQGIFTQFWNVVDTSRVRVPFGIAQQGKAFRNEVTPRNFTFRSREFEQMEIEFFIHPDKAAEWYRYWRDSRFEWWQSIGLAGDNLTLREHEADELAHYAKEGAGTSDVEYRFPFTAPGFGELEGVAHRTDYDLRQHANMCGKEDKLRYFDQQRNERYFPHVIEPSAGADRGTLALLCEAYTPDDSRASKVYMNFAPRMAPIKAAVFPLVNKDGMPEVAEKLYKQLRRKHATQFDVKQSIGKRYARMDEAGTPYCFTVDGDTLSDQTVTVRHRDTQEQQRIAIDKVEAFLAEHIG